MVESKITMETNLRVFLGRIFQIRLIGVGRLTLKVGDTNPWAWVLDCIKWRKWDRRDDLEVKNT